MFPIVPDVIEAIRAEQVRALALASAEASGVLADVPLIHGSAIPILSLRRGLGSTLRRKRRQW